MLEIFARRRHLRDRAFTPRAVEDILLLLSAIMVLVVWSVTHCFVAMPAPVVTRSVLTFTSNFRRSSWRNCAQSSRRFLELRVLELHHNLIEVVLLLLGALAFIAFLPLRRNRLHLFRVFTLFFWLNLLLFELSIALILKHTGDSLSVELARGLRFLLLLR
jgi:hypothetical protein